MFCPLTYKSWHDIAILGTLLLMASGDDNVCLQEVLTNLSTFYSPPCLGWKHPFSKFEWDATSLSYCILSGEGQLTCQIWLKPERLCPSFSLWTKCLTCKGKNTLIDCFLYASYYVKSFHMQLVVAEGTSLWSAFLGSVTIWPWLLDSKICH